MQKEMVNKLKAVREQINGAIAHKRGPKYQVLGTPERIQVGDLIITDRFEESRQRVFVPGRPTIAQLTLADPLESRR